MWSALGGVRADMAAHDAQRPDEHESDPARDDTTGHDWTDEGGATTEGPAEDPEASEEDTR